MATDGRAVAVVPWPRPVAGGTTGRPRWPPAPGEPVGIDAVSGSVFLVPRAGVVTFDCRPVGDGHVADIPIVEASDTP